MKVTAAFERACLSETLALLMTAITAGAPMGAGVSMSRRRNDDVQEISIEWEPGPASTVPAEIVEAARTFEAALRADAVRAASKVLSEREGRSLGDGDDD